MGQKNQDINLTIPANHQYLNLVGAVLPALFERYEQLSDQVDLSATKIKRKLPSLVRANIVTRIQDGNQEYVTLKCDPQVVTVYPKWLIERTVDLYNSESISKQQAMHYLEVLKQSHPSGIGISSEEEEEE